GSQPPPVVRAAPCAPGDAGRARRQRGGGGSGRRDSARVHPDLLGIREPGQRPGTESAVLLHVPRIDLDRQLSRGGGAAASVRAAGTGRGGGGERSSGGSREREQRVRRGGLEPSDLEERSAGCNRQLVRARRS